MLPLAHRLRSEHDLKTLFSKGKSVFGSSFRLRTRENSHHTSRFAFVVSTKISKEAVVRNRIRRRAAAAVREILKESPFCDMDIAITALPEAKNRTTAEFKLEFIELFLRSKVRLCSKCRIKITSL